MNTPSSALVYGFAFYVVMVAGLATVAVIKAGVKPARAWGFSALWLALGGGLAASGALAHFGGFPPPVLKLVLLSTLGTLAVCCSPLAKAWLPRWSMAGLVFFQAFRLPLELIMHQASQEGVMPAQMTWTGRNFDILTGFLAVPLALLLARGPQRGLTTAWNLLGLSLLVNVVAVAVLSVPGPFRSFMQEPANVWIGHAPFVWLPTVLVQLALAGHILVARKLWMER